jgi:hypothetical protein
MFVVYIAREFKNFNFLFVGYFATLSIAQTVWGGMLG